MYQSLLQVIAGEMSRFGEQLQPPCSPRHLKDLQSSSNNALGHAVPEGYLDLLRLADGLDWNGLQIYASRRSPIVGYPDRIIEGFVEGNLAYRDFEPFNGFLIFAGDGVALYVYDITRNEYQAITAVGLTLLETAPSFESLIAKAIQGHL